MDGLVFGKYSVLVTPTGDGPNEVLISVLQDGACIYRDVYYTSDSAASIEAALQHVDIYTLAYLQNFDLQETLHKDIYKAAGDYFEQIAGTRFYRHLTGGFNDEEQQGTWPLRQLFAH